MIYPFAPQNTAQDPLGRTGNKRDLDNLPVYTVLGVLIPHFVRIDYLFIHNEWVSMRFQSLV
jgi:hypothetical protein